MAERGGRRVRGWALAPVAVALLAAGCGSDDPPARGAATSTGIDATTTGSVDRIDAVVQRTVTAFTAAGFTVDAECVRSLAEQLPPDDLAALAAASQNTDPQATDPDLSDAGDALAAHLLECTSGGETAATPVGDTPATPSAAAASAATAVDVCSLATTDQLAALYTGLGEGSATDTVGPWGEGRQCAWETSSGQRVRLTVTDGIDVAAWATEATDGDGLGDGEPVAGLGDQAFVGRGSIGFVTGDRLVQIDCFPTFDITPELLTQTATTVAAAL